MILLYFTVFIVRKYILTVIENLIFCINAKINSREFRCISSTAKINSAKMQKFRGFSNPRNFLPAQISDNKVSEIRRCDIDFKESYKAFYRKEQNRRLPMATGYLFQN